MSSLSNSSYSFISSADGGEIWRFSNFLSLGRILNFLVRCLIFEVFFYLTFDGVLIFVHRVLSMGGFCYLAHSRDICLPISSYGPV